MQSYLKGIESSLVRDLVWCLLSPCPVNEKSSIPLVTDKEKQDWFNEHRNLIETWAKNDELYKEKVSELLKNNRLGYYFEALFLSFFYLSPSFEVVIANHQVVAHKTTIGEIDLIVKKDDILLHLELSVKFYLQTKESELFEDWVGPNGRDNFLKKRNKLINQQLKMTNYLDLGNRERLKSKALICGQFFQNNGTRISWQGNKTAIRQYLHRKDLQSFLSINEVDKVYLLRKPNWLSHQVFKDESLSYKVNDTFYEEIDKGLNMKKATLIGLLLNNMYQTLFIVSDTWPKLP